MKFRNNWGIPNKQWDKVQIKIRISKLDLLAIECDNSRNFYMIIILNFTFKNR